MTDLDTGFLERWAELEPERCKAFPRHATVQVKGKWNPAEFTGTILAAVIEAIEARGWRFVLVHSPWRTHRLAWEAYISRYEEGDLELARRDHDARTPAEAVLSAYLAALEAEASQ